MLCVRDQKVHATTVLNFHQTPLTIEAPIDAPLATQTLDDAAAGRRARSMHRGDRQLPRRDFRCPVARPHNNKLSGLIDAAEHELMPPTPKVDTEPRKEPCASRSQRA